MTERTVNPFNSALETGVRTLAILVASYPCAHDLRRLVQYDYLIVHSADADGPPSLHPPLPLRSGELLVRRGLVESGIRLMMSRGLIHLEVHQNGFLYCAVDTAGMFLNALKSSYVRELRDRAEWVASTFDALGVDELEALVKRLFEAWTTEFQPVQLGSQVELLL